MLTPWPRIHTLNVLDHGRDLKAYLVLAIRQAHALLSARADAQQFRVTFSGRSSRYMVVAQGSTISLSVSEALLQGHAPPFWVRRVARFVSSCAMSRCVVSHRPLFRILLTTEITSLEFAQVHIQALVDAETGLLLIDVAFFTWAAIWGVEWPRLAALSVTECGYVGANTDVRLRDEQVGTLTLQNDAHALARLNVQIQHAAGRRRRTEAAGVTM
jgi:hypothetical protein